MKKHLFVSESVTEKHVDKTETTLDEKSWKYRVYSRKIGKKIIDIFLPKINSKRYKKVTELLKNARYEKKIEYFYLNRICIMLLCFFTLLFYFLNANRKTIKSVYEEPTLDYDIFGISSQREMEKGIERTKQDNYFIDKYKNETNLTQNYLVDRMKETKYYEDVIDEKIDKDSERIFSKIQIVKFGYLKWFELLAAIIFAFAGYYLPMCILMLKSSNRNTK